MTSSTVAVGPSYFYEDEVFRINKNGDAEFGMVTENWDMYSSDDEDEEESPQDKVPHGSVSVTWYPKSKEEVVQENKVLLSDRSLMPGDVVRRLIAGKDTQRGYCRSVKVSADVQIIGSKKMVMGVAATTLLPVQKLQTEVAVYLDSWIGVIQDVKYMLHLKFADGSACIADSFNLLDNFEDIRKNCDFASDVFYPGQKLRGHMRHLKDADYSSISDEVKRAKDHKTVTVVVTDVQPSSLNVQWQWQTPPVDGKDSVPGEGKPPGDIITGDDLKRVKCLNLFESCTVQLNDISFYTPLPKDQIIDKMEWKKKVLKILSNCTGDKQEKSTKSSPKSAIVVTTTTTDENILDDHFVGDLDAEDKDLVECDENAEESNNNKSMDNKKVTAKKLLPKVCTRSLRKKKLKKAVRQQPLPKMEAEAPTVVETLHTNSVVDVVWQDGTYEEGMRSIDLYPIHHLDDHEFFPGDFVVSADSNDFKTYGVIQRMDHCGRVATVKWFETYSFNGEQKPKELEESEMSVYDIKDHPDFRFRPGTIVIRVANLQDNQCPAGQIVDNYPDGQTRVWWADGIVTPCWPQDLFRLGDYDSDDSDLGGGEDADGSDTEEEVGEGDDEDGANSDSSWETETEDDQNELDKADRYQNIGNLIERIQKTLVSTREAIVASSNVSVALSERNLQSPVVAVAKLGGFDERSLTKKLLLIYKDCQYLDKIMGTKYFDVEDLKKWHKDNESTALKSRRMMEQISRLFDVSRSDSNSAIEDVFNTTVEDIPAPPTFTTTTPATPTTTNATPRAPSVDNTDEFTSNPGMLLYELCSIILKKLLEAHEEYERKFGSHKNEHISATELLSDAKKGIEALAECLGKQLLKRHGGGASGGGASKASCISRQISYRVVLSAIDDTITKDKSNNSSTGKSTDAETEIPEEVTVTADDVEVSNDVAVAPIADTETAAPEIEITPEEDKLDLTGCDVNSSNFKVIDTIPDVHRYRLTPFLPQNQRQFVKTVQKELGLLRESLPEGIYCKGFEDRMDLYSVMIKGPEKTPYEDGLFLFDINLPSGYPSVPPMVHYISFCTDRLNPNLYEEGKVCVSLLGTWNGKGTEVWTSASSLLQLLVSIQGLILVPEPYYNEAGYEKQRGTQQGAENSRMYNENVLIKLVQSMARMVANPPAPWEKEVIQHIKAHGPRLIERYTKWLALNDTINKDVGADSSSIELPTYSLLPVSKGFQITLAKTIASFKTVLTSI